MKCSLGISNFLKEISRSFLFCCFPLFLCIDCWGRLSYLSLPFFGTLYSAAYILPFLLCFSLLFFSQLFTAGQRLIEFCQENVLVIANTLFQQHKRRIYTWTSPDGQHRNQIDYILFSQRWRSSIQLAKTRPGADYGSDHELLVAKIRLKLKKVGKPLDHSGMT